MSKLKLAAIILASTSVGAGIATLVTHHVMTKRNNEITADIRQHYERKLADLKDSEKRLRAFERVCNTLPEPTRSAIFDTVTKVLTGDSDASESVPLPVNENGAIEVALPDAAKAIKTQLEEQVREKYPDIAEEYDRELEEAMGFERHPDDPIAPEFVPLGGIEVPKVMTPYVITQNECGDGENDVDCLIYYDGDGTLTDEMDQVLNIDDYVGEDALEQFVNGLVYVRNNKYGMDYEVRWENGSFAEMVEGLKYDEAYPNGDPKKNLKKQPKNREEFN